jgi:hypothetical protein
MDTVGVALVVGGMAFLLSGLVFLIPVRGTRSQQESFEESQEQTEEYLREMRRNRGIDV